MFQIVMPDVAIERHGNMAAMHRVLSDAFPSVRLAGVARRDFNDVEGLDYVNRLKLPESVVEAKDVEKKLVVLRYFWEGLWGVGGCCHSRSERSEANERSEFVVSCESILHIGDLS